MSTAYIIPGNTAPITEIWAWVSVDEDGNEGIIGGPIPGLTPFCNYVMNTRERAEKLRPYAEQASRNTGIKVQLVRFVRADS